jgi:hypothetical protein
MTGLDDDRELDDFLSRRSALHRRLADRDHNEPPEELDRLVLNRAREAINVPANAPFHRAPRWALPVSLAATVVLALAVVMNFARTQHQGGGYPVVASATPAAKAAVEQDAPALPMAPGAPAPALAERKMDSFAAEPAPAEPEMRRERPADAAADMRLADASAAQPRPNSAPGTSAERASSSETRQQSGLLAKVQSRADVQMPAEVHAASDAVGAASATTSAPLAASGSARPHAPAASGKRAIVPAKRELLASSNAIESVAVTGTRPSRTEYASASPVSVVEAEAAPATSLEEVTTVGSVAPLSDKAKRADPQAWRREIERLRAEGKTAEANRELAEFRKAFPGEPAPDAAPSRDLRPVR